jgi:ATP-binding cassette, subfamily C (CFTR/MRP), member 1
LPKVLVASMLPDFLAPILPRLSLIAFRYSQPILISTAVRYLNAPLEEKASNKAYSVILMAVVVYLGLAVSLRNSSRNKTKPNVANLPSF